MSTLARIFARPRSAMQSGPGHQEWTLRFPASEKLRIDPLMGWAGSADTQKQVQLSFPSQEAAVVYAEANGIAYEVEVEPPQKPMRPKVYADNFRYGRPENWTH
jgi:hypothetical protein